MVNHTAAILEKKGGPPGKDRPYVRGEEALKKHYSYIKLIMQDGMSRKRPPAITDRDTDGGSACRVKKWGQTTGDLIKLWQSLISMSNSL